MEHVKQCYNCGEHYIGKSYNLIISDYGETYSKLNTYKFCGYKCLEESLDFLRNVVDNN